MKLLQTAALVSAAAISGAAFAGSVERESGTGALADADLYFAQVSQGLQAAGYRSITQSTNSANRFTAFDAEGSEVILTIHPDNGTVEATDFVREFDR